MADKTKAWAVYTPRGRLVSVHPLKNVAMTTAAIEDEIKYNLPHVTWEEIKGLYTCERVTVVREGK